ncbi:hypothetical protein ebA6959 [Aromatoleum aromaticum EbN1]|nr:hypothetical protein ebA6959 [Aromatoleum aromaticum EbN1]
MQVVFSVPAKSGKLPVSGNFSRFSRSKKRKQRRECSTAIPGSLPDPPQGVNKMIKWAIIFFVISVIAGLLGFTGVAAGAAGIARVLFYIALAIFLIVLVFGVLLGVLVF